MNQGQALLCLLLLFATGIIITLICKSTSVSYEATGLPEPQIEWRIPNGEGEYDYRTDVYR